ncbi:MAG: hypothetical protein WKF41_19420 [Gaiellaceae bacterium]
MPHISFLTPLAALIALGVLAPLAAFVGRERRASEIRSTLNLPDPPRGSRAAVAASLALLPALLGLAAAQPVLEGSRTRTERTDAEAFIALDISRSMFASNGRGADTRLERARQTVASLQRGLPEIPFGLASFNETVLPYVLPTTDARVIAATLADSLAIEGAPVPPLSEFVFPELTTSLNALAAIPRANFFSPAAEKRLLVVLTDGETTEPTAALARAFDLPPRIQTIFIRFWEAGERIYATGVAEPGYTPNQALTPRLERASSLLDGRVFAEDELGEARDAAERFVGSGPTRPRELGGERLALMPYVTLAAFLPLALLLWRRNL